MDEKLKKDVEALVASIFSEKEEADVRAKTEDALNKAASTIDELTDTLESKNTELEEKSNKVVELEEKQVNLENELEAAKNKIEEANNKLAEAEKALDEMKKDKAADERMLGLEKSGVLRSDVESQRVKVREMDDETFKVYREELESVRAAVLKEIEEAAKKVEEGALKKDKEKADEEEKADEIKTPPTHVDPGTALAAAMNLEIKPSSELIKKYESLGKAMASAMTKKNEG